ncbi:hypothetical protein FACS1894191_5670 [Clostridia bacterium]|nr:hypothetical protein FACS1894191_5670 [Clostridia bacterium]
MKKLLTLIVVLTMLLAGCGNAAVLSSASESPASETTAPAVSTASETPAEPVDIETELTAQLAEIQAALDPIVDLKNIPDTRDVPELRKQAVDVLDSLGYAVRQRREGVRHYELVTDFFDKAAAGKPARVPIYDVTVGYGSLVVSANMFISSEDGFSQAYAVLSADGGKWAQSFTQPTALEELRFTPKGNLIYRDVGSDEGFGYRVIPQPEEFQKAYSDYVALVDAQSPGVLNNIWSEDKDFRGLPWEFVFEEMWQRQNSENYSDLTEEPSFGYDPSEDSPYVAIPAGLFESTLQKYFDISTEALRAAKNTEWLGGASLYDIASGTYHIWGWNGGGYQPTTEVWGITNNPDGSISLELAWVALDFGNDGTPHSTLTVMPRADGGYKYVSNLFSKETVKSNVGYALASAVSADNIYQGGFITTGGSIEKNGYHFAAIDIENGDFYTRNRLGGLFTTSDIENSFKLVFTEETAKKYLKKLSDIPLYIDGGTESEPVLYINKDVTNPPIAAGTWNTDDMEVIENTPDKITVKLRFETADGAKDRSLTMVPGANRRWLLTDSYEGNVEVSK